MKVLELTFLHDRVKAGIDVHPSEPELAEFYRLAKLISPHQNFTYKGCQECVNHLVKFVFDNQNKINHENFTTNPDAANDGLQQVDGTIDNDTNSEDNPHEGTAG